MALYKQLDKFLKQVEALKESRDEIRTPLRNLDPQSEVIPVEKVCIWRKSGKEPKRQLKKCTDSVNSTLSSVDNRHFISERKENDVVDLTDFHLPFHSTGHYSAKTASVPVLDPIILSDQVSSSVEILSTVQNSDMEIPSKRSKKKRRKHMEDYSADLVSVVNEDVKISPKALSPHKKHKQKKKKKKKAEASENDDGLRCNTEWSSDFLTEAAPECKRKKKKKSLQDITEEESAASEIQNTSLKESKKQKLKYRKENLHLSPPKDKVDITEYLEVPEKRKKKHRSSKTNSDELIDTVEHVQSSPKKKKKKRKHDLDEPSGTEHPAEVLINVKKHKSKSQFSTNEYLTYGTSENSSKFLLAGEANELSEHQNECTETHDCFSEDAETSPRKKKKKELIKRHKKHKKERDEIIMWQTPPQDEMAYSRGVKRPACSNDSSSRERENVFHSPESEVEVLEMEAINNSATECENSSHKSKKRKKHKKERIRNSLVDDANENESPRAKKKRKHHDDEKLGDSPKANVNKEHHHPSGMSHSDVYVEISSDEEQMVKTKQTSSRLKTHGKNHDELVKLLKPFAEVIPDNERDEVKRLLFNLHVTVPKPVPPLHETYLIHLSLHQKELFQLRGCTIKQGPWSTKETQQLIDNMVRFYKEYNIKYVGYLLGIQGDKSFLSHLPVRHQFLRYLGKGIEERTLLSIEVKATSLLNNFAMDNDITEEDMEKIQELVEAYGKCWKKIGKMLNKNPKAIREKFRGWENQEEVTKGQWNENEDERLIQAVKKSVGRKNFYFGSDVLTGPLPWQEIAKKVPTRTYLQCRNHWTRKLYRCLFLDETEVKWQPDDDVRLILILKQLGVEESSDVDWKEVAKKFAVRIPYYVQHRWYRLRSTYIADAKKKAFIECLKELSYKLNCTNS